MIQSARKKPLAVEQRINFQKADSRLQITFAFAQILVAVELISEPLVRWRDNFKRGDQLLIGRSANYQAVLVIDFDRLLKIHYRNSSAFWLVAHQARSALG